MERPIATSTTTHAEFFKHVDVIKSRNDAVLHDIDAVLGIPEPDLVTEVEAPVGSSRQERLDNAADFLSSLDAIVTAA